MTSIPDRIRYLYLGHKFKAAPDQSQVNEEVYRRTPDSHWQEVAQSGGFRWPWSSGLVSSSPVTGS